MQAVVKDGFIPDDVAHVELTCPDERKERALLRDANRAVSLADAKGLLLDCVPIALVFEPTMLTVYYRLFNTVAPIVDREEDEQRR